MPTLKEQFLKDFQGLGIHQEITISSSSDEDSVNVTEKVNFETAAGIAYVSYYFSPGTFNLPRALSLFPTLAEALNRANAVMQIKESHESDDVGTEIDVSALPLSSKLNIYVDDDLAPELKQSLHQQAQKANILLTLRDRGYSKWISNHETPWAFISHDSRDKENVARPLAEKLTSMLCPVWYDEFSLKVGQSIRESIDIGLRDARKCIIVLSPEFLSNSGWTKSELNAIVSRHISGGENIILPVWHNVSRQDVFNYSPILADIKGLSTDLGMDELARQLFIAIDPVSTQGR